MEGELMPNKPQRPCNKPGCRELTTEGYCPGHKRDVDRYYNKHVRDQKAKEFYNSVEWRRAREAAIARDNGLCQHCLKDKRITPAYMVHHIVSLKEDWSLRLKLDNLVSICNPCHNKIHKVRETGGKGSA